MIRGLISHDLRYFRSLDLPRSAYSLQPVLSLLNFSALGARLLSSDFAFVSPFHFWLQDCCSHRRSRSQRINTTMDNYFDEVIAKNGMINGGEFGRRKAMARANAWYKNLAQTNNPLDLSIKGRSVKNIEVGTMYAFRYDPKTKDKLPYYDVFPLVFPVDTAEGGFYGLNFHYLPTPVRAKLLNALYPYTSDNQMDQRTKMQMSYKILKSTENLRAFKPCFKRYLFSHLRSPFLKIYSSEWETALLLPSQRFHKASAEKVWQDSLATINQPKKRKR